jgi:AcrR family transcriptional regulator
MDGPGSPEDDRREATAALADGADRSSGDHVDGRHRRATRTSHAIIKAYLSLVLETHARPVVTDVAARAGCSARSIFVRFETLDGLALATIDYVLESLAQLPSSLVVEGDRHDRIHSQVRVRAHNCETWLPLWRLVLRADSDSKALHARIERVRQLVRERLELVYRPELAILSEQRRQTILIALEALTDFECWGRMRERHKLSVDEACAIWCEAIDQLLPVANRRTRSRRSGSLQ